jgi:hypothetical protein
MLPLGARCQDDAAVFDVRIQTIAGADIEPSPQRTGKNNLAPWIYVDEQKSNCYAAFRRWQNGLTRLRGQD